MFSCNLSPHHFGMEVPTSIVVPSSSDTLKKESETSSQDGTNSTVSESEEFLLELEEIPQLLMVEMQKDNAEDVVKGLSALADLLRPENKHRSINLQETASCGGPSVLILVMKKWKTNEQIQTVGCSCVFYLSYNSASRNAVLKARGLETIVNAMKNFPTSKGIQFAGCGAIMKTITMVDMQGTYATQAQNATRRLVHNVDSMSVILRAMVQFREYSGFQAICCEALDELASDEVCCETMKKPNVVNVVAGTVDTHGNDECCLRHASSFMSKVTSA